MKRILLFSFLLMFCLVDQVWAQGKTITGKVTSEDGGDGLPGVNVIAVGTTTGTTTDIDGNFTISVSEDAESLQFSFIGYKTQTVSIGNQSTIAVSLATDVSQLSEVVVTGMSIEREKKELGYSLTSISGDEFVKARETNIVNALAGKVPGVQVTSSGGSVGGSTNILIRGASSLTGDNQPLFVVDGVPIFNSNIPSDGGRITGNIDTGNRAGDINPDDVESMTVLKGAAAAALYGQRAKNGVIIITTKRGKKGKGAVAINSSVRFDNALKLPNFQNEYGPGSNGKYINNSLNGWGPRIEGQSVSNFYDETVELQAFPDNVKDFYQTGVTAINSISISNGNENGDFRLGLTNLNQTGIVPNSELNRNSISFNGGTRLTEKISGRASVNYSKTTSQGRPAQGGNDPNILTSLINTLPRTFDLSGELKNYLNADGSQRTLDQFTNNPYWIANENLFTNEVDRVFGNFELVFSPIKNLDITGRVGSDFYYEYRRRLNRKGTLGRVNGDFNVNNIMQSQLNTDLFATYTIDIGDFNVRALVGHNINQITSRTSSIFAQELTVDGLYNFANAGNNTPTNDFSQRRLIGAYADVTLGYKDYLFFNLTGRNDWSSTLPKESNSFFYPSANLSFIFTQAFDLAGDVLSYGKFRANIAQVGSDEQPYQLNFRYFPVSGIFGQYGTGNQFPFDGQTAFRAASVLPPTNLKPQIQTQYEIGGEFQFFNGRIGLDLTYYDIITSEQIISIPTPQSTGYFAQRINVGETSNKGIEVLLEVGIIQKPDFNWNISANFAANRNVVNSLAEGVDEIVIQSAFNGIQVRAEPGETLGIYGVAFDKDSASGQFIIDPNTGLRRTGDQQRFGDIYPDFLVGVQNSFSYKGLTLSMLVDWRSGGVIFSETVKSLRRAGVAAETGVNREGTFIDTGVLVDSDGNLRPNDVPVQNMQAFWQQQSNASITEGGIYDASFVKFREVLISYSLPTKLLARTPFKGLTVGVEGRNLAILFSKVPHIDPETNLFGSGSNGAGIEFNNVPSTRSFGGNIKINF